MKSKHIFLTLILLISGGALFYLEYKELPPTPAAAEISLDTNKSYQHTSKTAAYEEQREADASRSKQKINITDMEDRQVQQEEKLVRLKDENDVKLLTLRRNNPNTAKKKDKSQRANKKKSNSSTVASSRPSLDQRAQDSIRAVNIQKKRDFLLQNWGHSSSISSNEDATKKGYSAVIHKDQRVSHGQTVSLRTLEPIVVNRQTIPANTLLTGFSAYNQNRVTITIQSVNVDGFIIPLNMQVYGVDGLPGIGLGISKAGETLNTELAEQALSAVSTAAGAVGGNLGRSIGNLLTGTARGVKREKDIEIFLRDRQKIIIKE